MSLDENMKEDVKAFMRRMEDGGPDYIEGEFGGDVYIDSGDAIGSYTVSCFVKLELEDEQTQHDCYLFAGEALQARL